MSHCNYGKPDTECHITFGTPCMITIFLVPIRGVLEFNFIDLSDKTLNKQYLHFKD